MEAVALCVWVEADSAAWNNHQEGFCPDTPSTAQVTEVQELRPEDSIFWCRNIGVLSLRIKGQGEGKEEAAVGGILQWGFQGWTEAHADTKMCKRVFSAKYASGSLS